MHRDTGKYRINCGTTERNTVRLRNPNKTYRLTFSRKSEKEYAEEVLDDEEEFYRYDREGKMIVDMFGIDVLNEHGIEYRKE